jgi:hypothetical protein
LKAKEAKDWHTCQGQAPNAEFLPPTTLVCGSNCGTPHSTIESIKLLIQTYLSL